MKMSVVSSCVSNLGRIQVRIYAERQSWLWRWSWRRLPHLQTRNKENPNKRFRRTPTKPFSWSTYWEIVGVGVWLCTITMMKVNVNIENAIKFLSQFEDSQYSIVYITKPRGLVSAGSHTGDWVYFFTEYYRNTLLLLLLHSYFLAWCQPPAQFRATSHLSSSRHWAAVSVAPPTEAAYSYIPSTTGQS